MPDYIEKYKKQAEYLIRELEKYAKERLIIVPGNHDSMEALSISKKTIVVNEGNFVYVHGCKIGLSHNVDKLPENCDLYLFGHCRTCSCGKEYLNGINSINIISIPDGNIYKLLYPIGTDDYRYRRTKIGI